MLEHATEIAVALWTAECRSCPIDALSVLKVRDHFLIRTELLETIQLWKNSPLYPLLADKRISDFRVLIGQTPIFTEVPLKDSRIQKLCLAPPSSLQTPCDTSLWRTGVLKS